MYITPKLCVCLFVCFWLYLNEIEKKETIRNTYSYICSKFNIFALLTFMIKKNIFLVTHTRKKKNIVQLLKDGISIFWIRKIFVKLCNSFFFFVLWLVHRKIIIAINVLTCELMVYVAIFLIFFFLTNILWSH